MRTEKRLFISGRDLSLSGPKNMPLHPIEAKGAWGWSREIFYQIIIFVM
jgi:hypothetical protein